MTPSDKSFTISPHNIALLHSTYHPVLLASTFNGVRSENNFLLYSCIYLILHSIIIFTSIGPDLAANIDCGNIHFSRCLPRPLTNKIFLNNINQSEIIDIVQSFKPKTSTGHEGLSMKLLKQIIDSIASPLE